MNRLIYIFLIILLLSGCKPTDSHSVVTIPAPEQSAPIESIDTTHPEITATALEDITEFQNMLNYQPGIENWIPFALGSVFDKPEDIDLEFMFYAGTDGMGWNDILAASEQELIDAGFWREMDLQVMPVSSLESALMSTFGISLSDITIPDSWYYLSDEDAYCSNNNDAYFVGDVVVTTVTEYSDGTAEVHYRVGSYYHTKTGEFLDETALILTLKRSGEHWLVYSNLIENVG